LYSERSAIEEQQEADSISGDLWRRHVCKVLGSKYGLAIANPTNTLRPTNMDFSKTSSTAIRSAMRGS
jgi:hypothetical protein